MKEKNPFIHKVIMYIDNPPKKSIGKQSKLARQTPNNLELNFNYLQSTKNAMNLTINLQDVLPFKEKNHIILEWKDNKWCNIFMDWKIQYYKVLTRMTY